MAAIVSSGGKKDMTTPGIYLQLGAEDARIYSGVYMADKIKFSKCANTLRLTWMNLNN